MPEREGHISLAKAEKKLNVHNPIQAVKSNAY